MRIRTNSLTFLIITFLALEIILTLSILYNNHAETNAIIQKQNRMIEQSYENTYEKLKEWTRLLFRNEIDNDFILERFTKLRQADTAEQSRIREEIYGYLKENYDKAHQLLHVRHIHFYLPDNSSFLRMHRPEAYGDDLGEIRPTVKYVNTNHKPVDGLEVGRLDYSYRFVYPLFSRDGIYLGGVEISYSFGVFKDIFDKTAFASMLIIEKEGQKEKLISGEFERSYVTAGISPRYYADREIREKNKKLCRYCTPKLKEEFEQYSTSHKGTFTLDSSVDDTTLFFTFVPMKAAISGEDIGYLVVVTEDTLVANAVEESLGFWIVGTLMLGGLFILSLSLRQYHRRLLESNSLYSSIIETIRHGYFFYSYDPNLNIRYISTSIKDVLGYTPEEFTGSLEHYYTDNPYNKKAIKCADESASGICQNPFRAEVYHKDGSKHWLEMTETPYFDEQNHLIAVNGIAKLVTNELRINRLIQSSQTVLVYWNVDEDLSVDYISKNISNFGYTTEDFTSGRINYADIIYPEDRENTLNEINELGRSGLDSIVQLYRIIDSSGTVRWIDVRISIERNAKGDPIFYLGTLIDITRQQDAKARLHYQIRHDELTGLPNRIYFLDSLTSALKRVKFYHRKLAVISIDFDRFKEINDSLGHEAGDRIIAEAARRFETLVGKESKERLLGRLGGDEFAIMIEDLDDALTVREIIEKLIDSTLTPFEIDSQMIYMTLSIGISVYPDDATNAATLLKNADAAMYKVKDDGRNGYSFYTQEMTQKALEHIVMETNLREGLKNNEFVVYYQPQIDAIDGNLIGLEALVRWKHPQIGLITPGKFVPLALKTGLILQIDRWVMRNAMDQIVKWKAKGYRIGTVALNLTLLQLRDSTFLEFLDDAIAQSGISPDWIELEVTEDELMHNPKESIEILTSIRERGIRLAIDDFGTGYSSLAYLKKMPISKLKIDRSFIQDLPNDTADIAIVQSVITLANHLHLKVLAEGVENDAQREFLIANGCDIIQGFFYSKPLSAEEVEEQWFKKETR